MSKRMQKTVVALACASLSACASMPTTEQAHRQVQASMAAHHIATTPPRPALQVISGPYIDPRPQQYQAQIKHPTSVALQNAPIGETLSGLLPGISVVFANGADPDTRVTLNLHGVGRHEATDLIARAAGNIALWPTSNRLVIAHTATAMFRIPTALFNDTKSTYTVGGNPSGTGSAGGSSGGYGGPGGGMPGGMGASGTPGGSSSGGSSESAAFTVTGAQNPSRDDVLKTIEALAGRGAIVAIDWTSGIMTVHGNADSLERVNHYIGALVRSSMTQVHIDVALVTVQLTQQNQFGINWGRVLTLTRDCCGVAGDVLNIGTNVTTNITSPSITASLVGGGTSTTASVNDVLKALQETANVSIITHPSIVASNHTPATLFSGTEQPYVGSVTSSAAGLTGSVSSGASLSYALDGVSLSFVPNIYSNDLVSIRLVPVLDSVGATKSFTPSSGVTLTGPVQTERQSYMQVLAHNDQTIILGGDRESVKSTDHTGVPGLSDIPFLGKLFTGINDNGTQAELVILMHVQIIPAPEFTPMIQETL